MHTCLGAWCPLGDFFLSSVGNIPLYNFFSLKSLLLDNRIVTPANFLVHLLGIPFYLPWYPQVPSIISCDVGFLEKA